MEEVACPACQKRNRNTKLIPKQINFDTAVYLCPLKKCKYPKGYPWLVINRPFDDFINLIRQKKQDEHLLNHNSYMEKKRKKDKFMKDALKIKAEDSEEDFNNILNDLNSISVQSNNLNNDLDIRKVPQAQSTVIGVNNVENTISHLSLNNDNIESEVTKSSCASDNLLVDLLTSSGVFSTSVIDELDDCIASSEMTTDDFNVDELLFNDMLQF